MDAEQTEPPWFKKALYLSGIRAPDEYRPWVAGVISDMDPRRRGLILAIPNGVMIAAVGFLSLAVGDPLFGVFLLFMAVVIVAAGYVSTAIETRRTNWLAKRNAIT
ncbi:MAG: hypothetical protein ACR2PK_14965 [Acidimicrobiales bacterium]